MKYIRKADERGYVDLGWLKSNHSFSFGSYYDPKHMGISVLRVINDDVVEAGKGFGAHGHKDMEIISYVIKGALTHKDSAGNSCTIVPGEIQRMSAGSGVMHSEFNGSDTEEVNFLQIWIETKINGITPSYEQKRIEQDGVLTALVTPNGTNGSIMINQNASLYRLKLDRDQSFELVTKKRTGYLHIIAGELEANGKLFGSGDAFLLEDNEMLLVKAKEDFEAVWFDLPSVY